MEKLTLIQWDETGNIVQVLIGIGEWDGESNDEHIFFWMELESDYQVGYRNGDGWTIIQIEQEEIMGKWYLTRPTIELNNEQVVVGVDHCDVRADFRLAVIQFIELYNGTVEPFYHITDKQAMCYSVSAKEILSTSSYSDISIPGGWGATIVWLPIHHVK